MNTEEKIQWHPAFCSAIELELREYKDSLIFEREYNLGKKPLEIDLLVIKKLPYRILRNEIADFFLGVNILEFKSPGDGLNSKEFFKALSYACLYKAEDEGAADISNVDVTVTLLREQKPQKLLRELGKLYTVDRKGDGIYRIKGLLFPMQILVTEEMDKSGHLWVTSLTRKLGARQAEELLGSYAGLTDETDQRNADSVLNAASKANIELFKKLIQGGGQMCEELKELIAPEIVQFKMQLAEKDAKLADNAAKLADNAAKLADKDAKLADKDAKIEELKKKLFEAGIEV